MTNVNNNSRQRLNREPPARCSQQDLRKVPRLSLAILQVSLLLVSAPIQAQHQFPAAGPQSHHFAAASGQPQMIAVDGAEHLRGQPVPAAAAAAGFAYGRPPSDQSIEKIIWPYDSFDHELYGNGSVTSSNVIERRRFVESVSSRCMTSTVMEDPMSLEPSFVLVRPTGETRLPATSSAARLMAAGYEPHKPTVLLIHGFTQSYPDTAWLRHTRALFERHQRLAHCNLFIMDWSPASKNAYGQAAAMVSGMGSFLANFLMKLYGELGADRHGIHLIGHSLGAHLAGFAGKRIRPRIGRITALDPAGPCFGKILSNSPTDRLSPDDAIEVDVYHYDDDFLGLPGQHGQFDVFVNGGSNQPGAASNVNSMFGAMVTMVFRLNRVLSESHTRSTEVSTVALVSQQNNYHCQLVAYECRDYNSFALGECAKCDQFNGQCFLMSFDYQYNFGEDPATALLARSSSSSSSSRQSRPAAPPLRTSFPGKRLYIQTSGSEAYCLQHHQILIKFEPTPEMAQLAKKQKWRLHLDVAFDHQQRANFTAHNQMAPNVFSYLLLSDGRPARIRSAELQVRTASGAQVPLVGAATAGGPMMKGAGAKSVSSYQVFAIEVQFMSDIDPHVRRLMSSRLCPTEQGVNMIGDSSASSEWLRFVECL